MLVFPLLRPSFLRPVGLDALLNPYSIEASPHIALWGPPQAPQTSCSWPDLSLFPWSWILTLCTCLSSDLFCFCSAPAFTNWYEEIHTLFITAIYAFIWPSMDSITMIKMSNSLIWISSLTKTGWSRNNFSITEGSIWVCMCLQVWGEIAAPKRLPDYSPNIPHRLVFFYPFLLLLP